MTDAKSPEIQHDQQLFDINAGVEYLRALGAKSTTKTFFRNLIGSGQLAHLKIGKKFYVRRAALDSWVERAERRMRP